MIWGGEQCTRLRCRASLIVKQLKICVFVLRRLAERLLFSTILEVWTSESTLPMVVLTEIDKLIIIETITDRPNIFLREIKEILHVETGTDVSISTIWSFLHTPNITRQKMILVAKQRDDFKRAVYLRDMQIFTGHPEMLIFLDETGADRRNCLRRFGYSIRGKPAISKAFSSRSTS